MIFFQLGHYSSLLGLSLLLLLTSCSTTQSLVEQEVQASSPTEESHTGTWLVNMDSESISVYLPPDGQKAYVMEGTPGSQQEVYEIPITKVSENWDLPEGTEVISLVEAAESNAIIAMQSEAKTYIGSMNRGQQAFFLEKAKFSSDVDELYLGINSTTKNYSYSIAKRTDNYVIHVAQTQNPDIKSYVGITYITLDEQGEKTTRTLLCESLNPGQNITDNIQISLKSKNAVCPSGFEFLTN